MRVCVWERGYWLGWGSLRGWARGTHWRDGQGELTSEGLGKGGSLRGIWWTHTGGGQVEEKHMYVCVCMYYINYNAINKLEWVKICISCVYIDKAAVGFQLRYLRLEFISQDTKVCKAGIFVWHIRISIFYKLTSFQSHPKITHHHFSRHNSWNVQFIPSWV